MNKGGTITKKILKAIGILLAIPVGLIFLSIIGIKTYNYFTQPNYNKVIESKDFKTIEIIVGRKPKLKSFAILPDHDFIVINGTIINRKTKTFGDMPTFGVYNEYYENGKKRKYESLDSLLMSISASITEPEINVLLSKMNSLELVDIQKNDSCNETVFRWAVSAMWCEQGIIKTDCLLYQNDFDKRTRIWELSKGYYKFQKS